MIIRTDEKVNGSLYGASQEPIKMVMEEECEAFEQKSIAKEIFTEVESDNYSEAFTCVTSIGDFEDVGEGGAYPENSFEEGYKKVIYPKEWKKSFSITQTMVEDGKIIDMKRKSKALIQSSGRTKENFFAALLGGGAYGTSVTLNGRKYDCASADGLSLFNTAHKMKIKGATQSNAFSNTLNADSIGLVETAMQNFCDEDGNVLNVSPNTIIIPNTSAAKKAAITAVASENAPNTANNDVNFQYGKWRILVWTYLNRYLVTSDNPMPYILMDSDFNESAYGAINLKRVELNIKSYIDNKNDNNVWTGRERYGGGFNNWRAFAIGGLKGGSTLS